MSLLEKHVSCVSSYMLQQASTPAKNPLVSVIVVNWNGASVLNRCLSALEQQHFRDFEIILVDNGSTDDSASRVEVDFPTIQVVRLAANLGFAFANNVGAKQARGQWLVLLNNDAFPEPMWLQALVSAAERYPLYSGFASLQIQDGSRGKIDGAGDTYHCLGASWRTGVGELVNERWLVERDVFAPCAAAAMYHREEFLAAGGFDSSFFCYFEDVDLAFRINMRGGKFRFIPQARVFHVGSATSGRNSAFSRYHGHRNLVWTFLKNMPIPLLLVCLPGHILLNVATLVVFAAKGEGATIFRAKRDAIASIARVLHERGGTQRSRNIPIRELWKRMDHGLLGLVRHYLSRTS